MQLTIQIHDEGLWRDAFHLTFREPAEGFLGPCSCAYDRDYIVRHITDVLAQDESAVSYNFPVGFDDNTFKVAPAFLHDISPAGAARSSLMRRIGGEKPEGLATDLFLLGRCTPAPIGNMRIKESAALIDQSARLGFPREEVIALSTEFIDYAYDQGAAIGGASGAGGAAPKILMTEDKTGLLYPDASLPDSEAAEHWFIKFPRGQALGEDVAILHAEYLYYKAIHQLGLNTVSQDGLALHEGRKPSLWMKRFDRETSPEGVKRYAVESIYSLAGVSEPGFKMDHLQVIDMLVSIWRYAGQEDEIHDLISEYLRRDLLNQVLGNTDNHGRNTSIIRERGRFKLAPIYDLAPMSADREGIIRTTRWPKHIELANSVNWEAACMSLGTYAHPARLYERLREDAKLFLHLPELLQPDLPDVIWNHPSIPLANLKDRMQAWGVL